MRVRWLSAALNSREAELGYLAQRNPRASVEAGDAIQIAVRQLADHPNIGRAGRVKGTRELVIGRTPYVLAYRLNGDTVSIIRFLHGARRWPARL